MRFWLILAVVAFSGQLQSEWVELPKLDPWTDEGALEPVKHFTPVDSRTHLIPRKKVKPSFIDDARLNVSTPAIDSSRWDGILEVDNGPDVPVGRPADTVIRLQAPAYPRPTVDHGNKSVARVDITTLESEVDPWLGTTPEIRTTEVPKESREASRKPLSNSKTKPSPTPPPTSDYYPNRTYTYLDPLVESLMLQVHQTLISQAGQPIRQKLHYLQSLQNNLLNQIWKRSQRLWVIEGSEARGHEMMSFPSLEGALLTISFLTFAVFLIKIVKQFIQGMQGQNATMIEVPIPNRRHRRDAFATQSELILKMIEEFHLQHARK